MKKQALLIDIDGTLANIDHRLHFVRGDKRGKRWDLFFKNLIDDQVNTWCSDIISRFKTDHTILLVSGRPQDYEDLTRQWLAKNQIHYDRLLMRKAGDFRKDCIIKEEIYKADIEPFYNVRFCVDDRKQVYQMWRSLGLVCLACAEGDF